MKIAIVKLSAMGDIVHAMVALQFLKEVHPSMQIDWVVEKVFAPVLEGNPDIDAILPIELKKVKKQKGAFFEEVGKVKGYASNEYDLVIGAQGLIKSAIVARLLGKKRAGFSYSSIREGTASLFYTQKVAIPYDANTIDRNVKVLGEPLEVSITPEMIRNKKPFLFYKKAEIVEPYLSREKSNVVFVIGSTWESRNYPKEHFAKVAELLGENILIAWGNDEERERAEWIAAHSSHATVLPKLDLNALKYVIGKADLTVGNDTGPTHMAWGLNRPSITLFGPTPTSRVYETPINKVIDSPSKVDPFHLNKEDFSIRQIAPEKVATVAKALLQKGQ